jgi:S-adenosylmethionine hydrolase
MALVTLFSDLGLRDASVAIARGILMQYVPARNIVDISHEIQPYNFSQAAYIFRNAYGSFPAGTCHVLLFDLYSRHQSNLILTEYNGHYFLSADNDLLPLALGTAETKSWHCFTLTEAHVFADWMNAVGNITRQVTKGELPHWLPEYKLQSPTTTSNIVDDTLNCDIIHIDHYENAVINVTRERFNTLGRGRRFRLEFMQVEEIAELSTSYHDVRPGYKLCRFNSNGYMEICINKGRAASLFGFRAGGKHNNIKLIFE